MPGTKRRKRLTREQKQKINTMFFGPYLEEWRVNGVIDNSDKTIAERIGVQVYMISNYLENETKKRFEKLQIARAKNE